MAKVKSDTLHVKGIDVGIYTEDYRNEYISLTDIARFRNNDDPRFAIQNWMRNRNTIEFLGLWESLHNPSFNRVQFDTFRRGRTEPLCHDSLKVGGKHGCHWHHSQSRTLWRNIRSQRHSNGVCLMDFRWVQTLFDEGLPSPEVWRELAAIPLMESQSRDFQAQLPRTHRCHTAEPVATRLDARALYPDSSLADLYDELTMPVELRKAHQNNDRAVMQAYGFPVKSTFTESQCVQSCLSYIR